MRYQIYSNNDITLTTLYRQFLQQLTLVQLVKMLLVGCGDGGLSGDGGGGSDDGGGSRDCGGGDGGIKVVVVAMEVNVVMVEVVVIVVLVVVVVVVVVMLMVVVLLMVEVMMIVARKKIYQRVHKHRTLYLFQLPFNLVHMDICLFL